MKAKNKAANERLVSIVDDDPSVRRSMRRLLSSLGLRVEAFASAEDFLQSEYVKETSCLLLDVKMPGMDGLGLQQHLADTGRQIPIIFLSARASEKEKNRALREGAVSFLHKPVGKDVLLLAICASLECTESGLGSDT
jgi:FixJ family two-component response regulator